MCIRDSFLSKCFGESVISFELDTSMTAGGVLADAFRVFNIRYDKVNDLPTSCFVKCTKEIPEVVELCLATQVYAKEVYFYSTLIEKVRDVIRVPECYGIFKDEDDEECKEFCLVLEDFDQDNWMPFDQFDNPMDFKDTAMLMRDLGSFHAACWNEPVSDQPGLGHYRAHWQSLNDSFWDEEGTAWDQVIPKWEEVYGEDLLSLVDSEVKETILKINAIYTSDNGKKIQELECSFRGAASNVIKVIRGSYWDSLLANDKTGQLVKIMNETVDGEYQAMKARDGAYVREKFFGKNPDTLEMVSSMSDKDIWRLNRGGHDPHKVYAAYDKAIKNQGSPTVIIAKTIKGYGMGKTGESVNTTHQTKKLDVDDLMYYRDRFDVPLTDEQVRNIEYFRPDEKSPEIKYIKERRLKLGGYLPERSTFAKPIKAPSKDIFDFMKISTGEKEMSTTMALVRMLTNLLRDKNISPRLVPIIPDEARTFGMEGFFQKIGIYAHEGQKYEPEDSAQLSSYLSLIHI